MFRDISRKNQRLELPQIISILNNEKRGVLSINGENGYPYCLPINYWYNEKNGYSEINKFAKATICYELISEHITGKIVNES